MAVGRDGYVVHRICRGAPVLLWFEAGGADGGEAGRCALLDRIAQRMGRPLSQVILRGDEGTGQGGGLHGLGGTLDETTAVLKGLIAELEAGALLTFGEGLGGHAALVYGVMLGASRIVAIEPPAHLDARELALYNDHRWQHILAKLPDPAAAKRYDVSYLLDRLPFEGRALVLFGTKRGSDSPDAVHLNALHAQRLARSDRVTLCPFPEVVQGPLGWLVGRGEAEAVLAHHLFDEVAPASCSEALPHPDPETLRGERKLHYNPRITLCDYSVNSGDAGAGVTAVFAAAGEVDATATRRATDEWRRWIAENLLIDASPGVIQDTLMSNGFSEKEAISEIGKAIFSPYCRGARLLQDRLKKRDWLLAVYRKLNRLHPRAAEIVRRRGLSRDEFLTGYYTTHRPVIIAGMLDDWPPLKHWGLDDLSRRFGDREVEVQAGPRGVDDREERCRTMTLADYISLLRRDGPATDLSLTAGDGSRNQAALAELWDEVLPIPEYIDGRDRRAVVFQLAPAGCVVSCRQDPTGTLLAQVVGRSRVKIVPSWDLPLWDEGRPASSPPDRGGPAPESGLPPDQPQVLECLLNPGDLLFRPIGCWHSLEVLEAAATLSFSRFAFDDDPVPVH